MADERFLDPARMQQVCGVCPSLVLALGSFDVAAKPGRESAYAREHGYRIGRECGTPVCVHPDKVGMPAAAYASAAAPLPGADGPADPPPLPGEASGLEEWLVGYLRTADEAVFEQTLHRAQECASDRFPPPVVTAALRSVLGSGLLV